MATADVTAEEIEDAPLLINPQVKELNPTTRSRLNFILCIVLAIDSLFQLIAIVTPGWNVLKGDIASSYESVYYTITCADTTPLENVSTTVCTSVSFLDKFSTEYNSAKDTIKPVLASAYNMKVRYQMNIQFSWIVVVGATIFQVIRYIRINEPYPRIKAIVAIGLIVACSAMYQAQYEAFVRIDLTTRQAEYLPVEAGFPYSLFLYSISFIQTCTCTVIVLKQIYDYMHHIKLALLETKVQVDTLQAKYEAEVEEFRHYRYLHSDKNQLRGRSRKSHKIDRKSHRGEIRPRHSTKVKEHSDNSPRHSENKQSPRYRELLERSQARSSRKLDHDHDTKYGRKHRRGHSPGTSEFSATSRDSSLDAGNHSKRHNKPSHESVQLTSQPIRSSTDTRDRNQDSHDQKSSRQEHLETRLLNSKTPMEEITGTNSVNSNSNTRQNIPTEQQMNNSLTNREQVPEKEEKQESVSKNNNSKLSQVDGATRTVFAEVHIPSIDGVEIKD